VPLSFQRDDGRERVLVIGSGCVTTEEFIACVARQLNDGLWRYGMIYDFRLAESIPSSADFRGALRDMQELSSEAGPRGPVAIVLTDPDLLRQSREYAASAKALPYRTETFGSLSDAESWLDGALRAARSSAP
jgi:hypothetical protein